MDREVGEAKRILVRNGMALPKSAYDVEVAKLAAKLLQVGASSSGTRYTTESLQFYWKTSPEIKEAAIKSAVYWAKMLLDEAQKEG